MKKAIIVLLCIGLGLTGCGSSAVTKEDYDILKNDLEDVQSELDEIKEQLNNSETEKSNEEVASEEDPENTDINTDETNDSSDGIYEPEINLNELAFENGSYSDYEYDENEYEIKITLKNNTQYEFTSLGLTISIEDANGNIIGDGDINSGTSCPPGKSIVIDGQIDKIDGAVSAYVSEIMYDTNNNSIVGSVTTNEALRQSSKIVF